MRSFRVVVAVALIGTLLATPALATDDAETDKGTAVEILDGTFDILVLRTSGFLALAVGSVLFAGGAILTSPGGMPQIREALDLFVLTPSEYVFERPIGDI